jgi:hypothetical protein
MIQLPELPKCTCGEEIYKRQFLPTEKGFIGTPEYRLISLEHTCNKKVNHVMSKETVDFFNQLLKK